MSAAWQRRLPTAAGLWPAEAVRLSSRPGAGPALLLLPSGGRPRMLVPAGVPAAHRMLHRNVRGLVQRAGQEVLARGQRAGALRFLPLPRLLVDRAAAGADGVDALVAEHVPGAVATGVLLGPPRANAKPVLQVFDAAGRTVAFGKVGHDALSAALVRREAQVLGELAGLGLTRLEVPRVLHAGVWRGQEVLLMTALSASQDRASTWQAPTEAMVELAGAGGVSAPVEASASPYLAELGARVAAVPGPAGERLAALAARVRPAVAGATLVLGRWHGDWAPWNMARSGGSLQVWDWERSADGVPVGYDLVHFALQKAFREECDATQAQERMLAAAREGLGAWYPGPPPVHETVLLYLLEILQRYLGDAGDGGTGQLRTRVDVAASVIDRLAGPADATQPKEHRADA